MNNPLLSVIVPTFNEEKHIAACVNGLLNQTAQFDLEIIVVDGRSEDKTRKIVEENLARNKRPNRRGFVIDNPKRRTPYAFNLGIEHAKGKYLIILGAHTEIPKDWCQLSVDAIESEPPDVVMAGGRAESIISPENKGPFAEAIGYVTTTFWGGGVSEFRYSKKRQYVETAPYGIYRKEVFDELGGFDTDFAIGQDGEFSARIRKNEKRILFEPKIVSKYYPRNSLRKLVKQMFRYGIARSRIIKKHGTWKAVHFFPLALLGYQAVTPALLFVNPLLLSPAALYALVTFAYSLGRPSSLVQNFVSYCTIHSVFGLGMAVGFMPQKCCRPMCTFRNPVKKTT